MAERLAAIDIGTNSTRLLVADVDGTDPAAAAVQTLDRRMRITRLGQGVDDTRTLRSDAIGRTLDVLREYCVALDELGVRRARATATSAARDATNRDDFFTPANVVVPLKRETGTLPSTTPVVSATRPDTVPPAARAKSMPARSDAPTTTGLPVRGSQVPHAASV